MSAEDFAVGVDDIRAAAARIADATIATPTVPAPALSARLGCDLFLKLETLQVTGSFKPRGALNKLLSLPEDARRRGVIAMSAGNHAQGVAYHAGRLGIPATIVMPLGTPFTKIASTEGYGATVDLFGHEIDACRAHARKLADERGLTLIHPYDDPAIIAGQGSVALEMLAAVPDLQALVVPIGGGGLMAGIAIAARAVRPDIALIGVQSAAYPTLARDGRPLPGGTTLAEGIAVRTPGSLTRPVIGALVDDILVVDDSRIEQAIALMAERANVVAEGAGAAGLAAIMAEPERFAGVRVGLVVCGGNIDNRLLSSVLLRSLITDGRMMGLRLRIEDRPGALASLVGTVADVGGNIVEVAHRRLHLDVPVKSVEIDIEIETRGPAHGQKVIDALQRIGAACTRLDEID
ncbi:MAG: threonine ammonia-lyase [Alphaproteobacteria bacterium]